MKPALALLLLALAACSEAQVPGREDRIREAQAALAQDASRALHLARAAQVDGGPDARLSLVEGLACLRLERRSEARAAADAGLAAADLGEALHADLSWVRGAASMALFRELSDPADWRAANEALEVATGAGAHRAEAAAALALLQDLGTLGSDERQLRFARLLLELEPDGAAARAVRATLERKGLSP